MEHTINNRVKMVRETLGYTSAMFAQKLNVKAGTVSMLETGTSKPGAEILIKISDTFGVPTDWLLKGEGEMFKNGKTPEIATPIKVKEVKEIKIVETPSTNNAGFLEKQVLWLQGLVEKLQAENAILVAK